MIEGVNHNAGIYRRVLRSRNALAITETELKLIAAPAIIGLSSTLRTIQVPPGKSMVWTASTTDPVEGISGYVYGFLTYPSFVTQGTYTGTALITSPNFGLVAGLRNFGAGRVLFVNTPLSYLKGQTDGMLMHGFLPETFGSNHLIVITHVLVAVMYLAFRVALWFERRRQRRQVSVDLP